MVWKFYSEREWREMAQLSGYRAAELAKQLNISQRQLQRRMLRQFSRSPQTWLNQQWMLAVARRLMSTRSIKLVSIELGRKDIAAFSHRFKRQFGLSPTAFLEAMNSDFDGEMFQTSIFDNRRPRLTTNVRVRQLD